MNTNANRMKVIEIPCSDCQEPVSPGKMYIEETGVMTDTCTNCALMAVAG